MVCEGAVSVAPGMLLIYGYRQQRDVQPDKRLEVT